VDQPVVVAQAKGFISKYTFIKVYWMEHMELMFLCPQGDTVYRDNTKSSLEGCSLCQPGNGRDVRGVELLKSELNRIEPPPLPLYNKCEVEMCGYGWNIQNNQGAYGIRKPARQKEAELFKGISVCSRAIGRSWNVLEDTNPARFHLIYIFETCSVLHCEKMIIWQ